MRAHAIGDFEDLAAMWADPLVVRHISGTPSSRQASWMRLLRYGGLWPLLGFGYWALEEKTTGRFLGDVGFADFKREMEPSIAGVPEVGWVLASEARGKGFATEAVRAALAWGERHFESRRTVCIIAPENAASIRVAEKCGYREVVRTTIGGEPTILFER